MQQKSPYICVMKRRLFLWIVMMLAVAGASAQIVVVRDEFVNADSIRREYDRGPNFGLYKDNYFIFGPSIGQKPTRANTNVKFQISIQQKLTRSTLPWGTYLYLFYTQKVFWNVLENSLPMTDLNFNPGIGLAKPLFSSTDGRYLGKLAFVIEHESNGRDGEASRSWNRVTFSAALVLDRNLMVHAKLWIPIVDGQNNRDILKYNGIYQGGLQVMSNNRRFGASVLLTKRLKANVFDFNTTIELKYRFFKNDNQYFFAQFYNGYGEGLLDYNKFHSQLRIGICLSPTFFSDF